MTWPQALLAMLRPDPVPPDDTTPPDDTVPPDEAVRVRLGAAASTPADLLLKLALDHSVTVRAALALNPAAPPAVLGVLARDTDERVRVLLATKLAALAPSLNQAEQSRLNQQAIEALGHLVEDTAVWVRASIAEVVKEMPNAPHELVLRLARDTALQVSEPVVRLSPLLTQADLLSLLAASDSPEIALAVARRPSLTEDVADALADTADVAAIRAMLLNQSAQIREATLDALIRRAADQISWHEPLVRRPSLSPRNAEALSRIVADTLLEELASRSDLAPAVIADLRARLTARLGQPPRGNMPATMPVNSPANPPADPATTDVLTATRTGTEIEASEPSDAWAPTVILTRTAAMAEARERAAIDRLAEADLLGVAGRGDARLASAMLAVAADVPLAVVEHATILRSAKGVVSLVWKAGFSMRVAVPLQRLLARTEPGSLLTADRGGGFPLAIEEMRWQIQFLSRGAR